MNVYLPIAEVSVNAFLLLGLGGMVGAQVGTRLGAKLKAEKVIADLSQSRISITTDFDGSEIPIFGAVKRDVPIDSDAPLQVLITVEGPSESIIFRRKAMRFGIGVNTDAVEVDAAPSFYAIATSARWGDVISDVEDLRHHVSTPRAIRSVGADIHDSETF